MSSWVFFPGISWFDDWELTIGAQIWAVRYVKQWRGRSELGNDV